MSLERRLWVQERAETRSEQPSSPSLDPPPPPQGGRQAQHVVSVGRGALQVTSPYCGSYYILALVGFLILQSTVTRGDFQCFLVTVITSLVFVGLGHADWNFTSVVLWESVLFFPLLSQ